MFSCFANVHGKGPEGMREFVFLTFLCRLVAPRVLAWMREVAAKATYDDGRICRVMNEIAIILWLKIDGAHAEMLPSVCSY